MPLTDSEREIVEAEQDLNPAEQRYDNSPTARQKLGRFTVVCLILNRTIGSGIFVTPSKVLAGTGSVGGSLLFWAAGAIIATCGLLVWLECSLSIPQRPIRGETEPRGVPRSGGEKNYLEFMFPGPKFRTTSIYGIMFIILGNLSGNAIAFGIQVLEAANRYNPLEDVNGITSEPNQSHVIGLAIGALSLAILLHICSRRGGILVNNAFAVTKVLILLAMICLGIAKACGRLSPPPKQLANFNPSQSFRTKRHDVPSYTDSLLYLVYTYSGFEQPFYVLSEVKNPRKVFPRWTLVAMGIATFLFIMVNVAYLFAVPKDVVIDSPNIDMATLFFEDLFGSESGARRAMASLIAFSIFGNIVVMTFTAARVKQEIAKEGILLKYSLMFATSHTTIFAKMFQRYSKDPESTDLSERLEQTPIAALLLHWATSVLLILVTIPASPTTAYNILVSLYSYTIIVLFGMWVSFGLLLTKLRTEKFNWQTRRRYRPFISPLHAIVYFSVCCFVLVAAFVPPAGDSPYAYKNSHIQWYIIPSVGLSAPLWGLLWYGGIKVYLHFSRYDLLVDRYAFWMKDPDNEHEYIQRAEIVSHIRQPKAARRAAAGNVGQDEENGYANVRHTVSTGVENEEPNSHVGTLLPQNQAFGRRLDDEYEMGRYGRMRDGDEVRHV